MQSSLKKESTEKLRQLFPVAELSEYYHILPTKKSITITLSRNEMAAFLQVYDYGINSCNDEGKRYLDSAISEIKQAIYP